MMQPAGQNEPPVLGDLADPASLHNPFASFAPPHHQSGHEEGDQDGHHDERTQDAVRRVPQEPARQRAVVEVVLVHSDEELVHQAIGPEALHLQRHQERAVRQLAVQPGGGDNTDKEKVSEPFVNHHNSYSCPAPFSTSIVYSNNDKRFNPQHSLANNEP